jgi:hypothetical protein
MEDGPFFFFAMIYPLKMVVFHGYARSQEGNFSLNPIKNASKSIKSYESL